MDVELDRESLEESNHSCSNDGDTKRPKRFAAQRAQSFFLQEQTSVLFYKEERDIKRALKASLAEARRRARYSLVSRGGTNHLNRDGFNKSSSSRAGSLDSKDTSKIHRRNNNYDLKKICEAVLKSNSSKKPLKKISAQRKFAQSSGSNTPISSPVKCDGKTVTSISELFPKHRPSTEDFLTFLCLRNTKFLPPHLDFYALNGQNVIRNEDETDDDVSKKTALVKETSHEAQINGNISESTDNKITDLTCDKSEEKEKKNRTNIKVLSSTEKASMIKKSSIKLGPSQIQTRIMRSEKIEKKCKSVIKPNFKKAAEKTDSEVAQSQIDESNVRKLRSNRCITVTLDHLNRPSYNKSPKKKKRPESPIGIRPHKRKAKPDAPLIDLHYIIDGDDSENETYLAKVCQPIDKHSEKVNSTAKETQKKRQENLEKQEVNKNIQGKTIENKKVVKEDVKSNNRKRIATRSYEKKNFDEEKKEEKKNDENNQLKNKVEKKEKSNIIEKRVTRSLNNVNNESECDAETRETLIKQQMMAIERRHRRKHRYPSECSVESSTRAESASSNSSTIPRLTRSFELIKRLRAKARMQNKAQNSNCLRRKKRKRANKAETVTDVNTLEKTSGKNFKKGNKKSVLERKPIDFKVKAPKFRIGKDSKTNKIDDEVSVKNGIKKPFDDKISKCVINGRIKSARIESQSSTSNLLSKKSLTQACLSHSNEIGIQTRATADASTSATEEDILACTGVGEEVDGMSVGTQTIANMLSFFGKHFQRV